MKFKKLPPKKLNVDTLICMVCKKRPAVWRQPVKDNTIELKICLCDTCQKDEATTILGKL